MENQLHISTPNSKRRALMSLPLRLSSAHSIIFRWNNLSIARTLSPSINTERTNRSTYQPRFTEHRRRIAAKSTGQKLINLEWKSRLIRLQQTVTRWNDMNWTRARVITISWIRIPDNCGTVDRVRVHRDSGRTGQRNDNYSRRITCHRLIIQ